MLRSFLHFFVVHGDAENANGFKKCVKMRLTLRMRSPVTLTTQQMAKNPFFGLNSLPTAQQTQKMLPKNKENAAELHFFKQNGAC